MIRTVVMPRRDDRPSGRAGISGLLTIAVVLVAAWFLRTSNGPSPASLPPAARTTSVPAPAEPAPAQPGRTAAAPAATDDRYDLEADETRGGHTLSRHVGRSDAQLRERLANEPGISTASTYTSRALAERTVARALRDQAGRVQAWSARSGNRPNLEIDYRGPRGEIIGRSIRRGEEPVDCTNALIVLRWAGRGYYVLTTYPEPPR
jgi:Bacterial CdiA-CT RNAse A domain